MTSDQPGGKAGGTAHWQNLVQDMDIRSANWRTPQGRLGAGSPEPLGVTPDARGLNVAVYSEHAAAIEFCLFDGDREVERIRLPERTGNVFHAHIAGLGEGVRYGLRAYGAFDPPAGHRFNPAKLLVDPYATRLDRPFRLHPTMFSGSTRDDRDSGPYMPKAVVTCSDETARTGPFVPWPSTIVYELHVRGFTKRHPGIPGAARGTFAGLGHPAAIEHLVKLGITTVEIMPAAAWVEERHLHALGLTNYWGYNPVSLMAPDPRLAPGGWNEIRTAVRALQEAGIEVILDVVLNHSGEGDALGPTLSLRGLDNISYYRLCPDDPAAYVDDTGCGNTLALDRPPVVRLAMDALRGWVRRAGIQGFRFDLATTLGRRDTGFDPHAPLLTAIAQDPELRDLKLIAEPWDIGPDGYQLGRFPPSWREWNDRFRDDVRRFWRGDPHAGGAFATRLAGSADLFGGRGRPSHSVNFVVAHDGFTLADLVAHTHKHNAANGEHNRDGADSNYSWNNGVEGATDDPVVAAARFRDQCALLATLLLARGTPMLTMGAELGHSQRGNNNGYAQDNETSWIHWEAGDPRLMELVARLVRIRRDHPALHADRYLTGDPYDPTVELPDVEWRSPCGRMMTSADWEAGTATLVMLLSAPGVDHRLDRIAIIVHRGSEPVPASLPPPQAGHSWVLIADSADAGPEQLLRSGPVMVGSRSVLVIAERPES